MSKFEKDSLGTRMKCFENISKHYLVNKIPVIIRLDGKAFHSFTKKCTKPFDSNIIDVMSRTCEYLVKEIQGCKIGYVQSDEISLVLTDYDKENTSAWFDYSINKICSVSAAMCSVFFTIEYGKNIGTSINESILDNMKIAHFDARSFNLPKNEVINYLRWRYQDWLRNSIQMLAQSLYSQKQLHGKKKSDLHELCFQAGYNWDDLLPQYKNGTLYLKEKKNEKSVVNRYVDFNLNSVVMYEDIKTIIGE